MDSTILLHLDSEGCTINISVDKIDSLAFSFDHDRHYIVGEADNFKFNCHLCDRESSHLTGLFQHADARICGIKNQRFFKRLNEQLMAEISRAAITGIIIT